MALAISMQWASWLLLSGLSTEAQQSMQNLPFDSQALSVEQMDSKLHGLKDSCTTLKALGFMSPVQSVGRHLPKHPAVSHLSMSPECQDNSLLKRDEQNHELHTPPLNSNFSGYNQKVVLLTEGLSSRAVLVLELKNSLESLSEKLGSLLDFENHSSEVPVARAELIQIIEICQALRNRLQRNHQATGMDNLALSWMISGRNLEKQPMTLIDLCYGKIENVNLRYLSALEEKLSKLFKHLLAMRQTLSFILAPGQESCEKAHQILPTAFYARLLNHVTRCHQSLEECCSDLLVLTLIVPSAPWSNTAVTLKPVVTHSPCSQLQLSNEQKLASFSKSPLPLLQQQHLPLDSQVRQKGALVPNPWGNGTWVSHIPVEYSNHLIKIYKVKLEYSLSQEFTVENVLAILPAFPKGAPQQRAKRAAEALVKASNYSRLMAIQQIHALQAELNFHKSLYNLQVKYTEAVFEGIKQAYHTFQENVVSVLCSPLQGDEALSRFGKEFFFSLENSLKDCGEQRDKAASEMETLQTELALAFENLQSLRKERKKKKTESIPHFTKSEVGESAGGGAASSLDKISKDNPVPDSTPLPPPHSERPLPKHVSAMAEASSNSSSRLQQQSSKGFFIHQKGKSSHRNKSMKTTARPPWQD
ncbi:hypothetical protein UY3_01608 [Chelonia mydas]|uniref:Uncharacterized protein n=1 Tax=Chelonia mydas TaxID=8469 RepID=M7C983_CHEMY|nr:hypothetical protein UY3_01608 [Chelonia mydas]